MSDDFNTALDCVEPIATRVGRTFDENNVSRMSERRNRGVDGIRAPSQLSNQLANRHTLTLLQKFDQHRLLSSSPHLRRANDGVADTLHVRACR